jgi:hypothetical protein
MYSCYFKVPYNSVYGWLIEVHLVLSPVKQVTDDLWLDKIIPKNNDEGRVIYGNLENKINTLYWPVENSIPKNNDRSRL